MSQNDHDTSLDARWRHYLMKQQGGACGLLQHGAQDAVIAQDMSIDLQAAARTPSARAWVANHQIAQGNPLELLSHPQSRSMAKALSAHFAGREGTAPAATHAEDAVATATTGTPDR